MQDKKPSEKILSNNYDGKEIIDSEGRKLRIKKPDILDLFDLMSALGDDSKNPMCAAMAQNVLYIATIDGLVVESPKSYSEVRVALKRIGEHGIKALSDFLQSLDDPKTDAELIDKAKK